jgi:hypothetical protein
MQCTRSASARDQESAVREPQPRRRLSPPQPISAPLESQLALSALVAMDDSVKQAVDVLRRLLRKVRPTLWGAQIRFRLQIPRFSVAAPVRIEFAHPTRLPT